MLTSSVNFNGAEHIIRLKSTDLPSEAQISIKRKGYKLFGHPEVISTLKGSEFESFRLFEASLKNIEDCSKTKAVFENVIFPLVSKIRASNGSLQAIKRILSEMTLDPASHLDIALALARSGDTIKACNVFFFLKSKMHPEERDRMMLLLGIAFAEYGINHKDLLALECSDWHLGALKNATAEQYSQKVSECLQKVLVEGDARAKKQAQNLLDSGQIHRLIKHAPINNDAELVAYQNANPSVNDAFTIAEKYQQRVDNDEDPSLKAPGELIPIQEGSKTLFMHVKITGNREKDSDPIVIFESGLGCISSDWKHVQDNLPPNIKVMSYDRAGTGWSSECDSSATERTLSRLQSTLEKCGLKPPYLFVGHSYGGILSQLYALKHPEQMAGIILVDSSVENIENPSCISPKTDIFDYLPPVVQYSPFYGPTNFLDDKSGPIVATILSRSPHNRTLEAEDKEMARSKQLLREQGQLFKFPIRVISRGLMDFAESKVLTEKEKLEENAWKEQQRLLLKKSAIPSEQIIAEKSDHMIPYHYPGLIGEQIQNLLKIARSQ